LTVPYAHVSAVAAPCGAACAAGVIAESNTRDKWLSRILAAEVLGYRRGIADAEAAYGAGYAQCAADVKAAQHAIYRPLARNAADEAARWGPGGRARFADPRPGDYRGGPVSWLGAA